MSTIYTWSIQTLDRTIADGIVYRVRYAVDAIHEVTADEVYNVTKTGYVALAAPAEGDPVIPYENLTEEVVLGWTKDALGTDQVEALEGSLQTEVDELLAPTKAAGVPWS